MKLFSKVFKLDLSKTEDKLKLFILVSGLLIFIGVSTVTAIELTMSPNFCSTCHNMQPEFVTWKATSHASIRCTECHIPPGVINLIEHKIASMKELYLYATNSYETPIAMKHPIDNYVCQKCHSIGTRNFTTSGDIIIPHQRHIDSKLATVHCVDCHSGVAHGKIARRGVTAVEEKEVALHDGDLGAWTTADGKNQTIREFSKAAMDDCIACHAKVRSTTGKGKPSIKCEVCHQTIKTPDNHTVREQWLPVHGKDAEKDINICKSCHSYGMKVSKLDLENKAAAYAWGNEYCYNCHNQAPANHKRSDWRKLHKVDVATKGKANCQACHNLGDVKGEAKAPADVTCSKCH